MQNKRKSELDYISSLVDFLAQQHPTTFVIGGYEHPVFGARKTLTINKDSESLTTVDYDNLNNVEFDIENNSVILRLENPSRVVRVSKIVKDETVV